MALDQVMNLNAEQAQAGEAMDLDLSQVNDPLDAFNGINLEQVENNPPAQAPNETDPPKKKGVSSMSEAQQKYNQLKQSATNWGERGFLEAGYQERNPLQANRVVEFDAKKLNLDRYLGYGKTTFNKVGFNPFIDNEKHFSENTNIWNDYRRTLTVLPGMLGLSIKDSFAFGAFADSEEESAAEYTRLSNIGMSSRSGPGAFMNNLTLSLSYSLGVGASILAEEGIMLGAEYLTGGMATPVVAARTGYNMKRLGTLANRAFGDLRGLGNVARGGVQLAKSLGNINDAKNFYTMAKAGALTIGKGAFQLVNPLTRTVDDIADIARGSASVRNLSNMAKMKKTFGSFYRDARDINIALNEAELEGYSKRQEEIDRLMFEYEKANGKKPEGEDLQSIYAQAEDVKNGIVALNMPVIFYTNRITFDGLFKFRGFKTLEQAAENADLAAKGVGFKPKAGFFDISTMGIKGRAMATARTVPGAIWGYSKRNVAEGIQENLQNIIAEGNAQYYNNVYRNDKVGNFDLAMGSALSAAGKEFSGQGLETFASGFLMGGLAQPIQRSFLKDVPSIYYRGKDFVLSTNEYSKFKEQKKKERADAISALNQVYKNPLDFFSNRRENAAVQYATDQNMNLAEDNNDSKTFHDAKDVKNFEHVFSALSSGNYKKFIDGYRQIQKLDDKEIASFLGIQDASKAKEKIQEVITRAEQIKQRYEVAEDQFKNPFNPKQFVVGTPEHTTEALAFKAYEQAKKTLVLSQHGFDRALGRMNGLYNEIIADKPLEKSAASDYSVLLDKSSIQDEISILKKEIGTYDESDRDQKKIKKAKQDRLDALKEYSELLEEHLNDQRNSERVENGTVQLSLFDETNTKLYDAYKKYLGVVAKQNNNTYDYNDKIASSYRKLLDYYSLGVNAQNYNKVINTLLDPDTMYRHANSLNDILTDIFNNREQYMEDSMQKAMRNAEVNELIKAMAAQGIAIDPDQLVEFVNTGKRPTQFIDSATGLPLEGTNPKYAAAMAILDVDDQIKETPVQTAQEEQQPAEEATEEEQKPAAQEMPADLQRQLRDEYANFIADTGSDATFDEFVSTNPKAARIKREYAKKQQPAETTAAVLQPNVTPVAEATGTARTEPVTTATETAPVSDIEAKKADLEKRRKTTFDSFFLEQDPKKKTKKFYEYYITPAGRTEPVYGDSEQEVRDQIAAKYDTELAALEGAKPAETTPAPVTTAAEKTGTQKAQDLVDSVSSIKDLPNLQKADSKPISIDLIELISTGQVKSSDVIQMLRNKEKELLQNLSTKDLQKGDILTFVDNSKGVVTNVVNGKVNYKKFDKDKSSGSIEPNDTQSLKQIKMIEPGKAVSIEETPDIQITPEEKKEVEASKDTLSGFTENTAEVKKVGEDAGRIAGTDNAQNLTNLIQNLGCKTGQ